jgi:hypothetical protein
MSSYKGMPWLSPKGAIYYKVRDLQIDEQLGVESTHSPATHPPFSGAMQRWNTFNNEVYRFITSPELALAFHRTVQTPMDIDPITAVNELRISEHTTMFTDNYTTATDTEMKDAWHKYVLGDGVAGTLAALVMPSVKGEKKLVVFGYVRDRLYSIYAREPVH